MPCEKCGGIFVTIEYYIYIEGQCQSCGYYYNTEEGVSGGGYGVFHYSQGSIAKSSAYINPLTDEEIEMLLKDLNELSEYDAERSYLTITDRTTIPYKIISLFGETPLTYEQYENGERLNYELKDEQLEKENSDFSKKNKLFNDNDEDLPF